METITIKILGGIVLWACMVIFGLLPLFNNSFKTNSKLLSLCNCFCGGLFIAIGLIHILPEAHEMLDEDIPEMVPKNPNGNLLQNSDDGGVQWSYLICLLSFSFILFLDKVLFNNSDIADENDHVEKSGTTNLKTSLLNSSIKNSMMEDSDNIENNFKEMVSSKYKIALKLSRNSNLKGSFNKDPNEFHEHDKLLTKPKLKIVRSSNFVEKDLQDTKEGDLSTTLLQKTHISISDNLSDQDLLEIQNQKNKERILKSINEQKMQINIIKEDSQTTDKTEHTHDGKHSHDMEGHHHHNLVSKNDSLLTCIILLIAMGIHGFFALMAFGIEPSKTGTVNLFIALIVHKWSEALTVGNNIFVFKNSILVLYF
jgi:zinc transporter 1/2/3